ncbi:MAG: ABC transporter permease [Fervidobacterium sp.]|uniref:ABC-2 type transport system permease protein n=1 Tax=Fervidobacterium gondwanense DSM 13020 TaxID=1121883 RepID=A0A1M7S1L3_FERGO|nr:ABC transporter permease [Fervidobacterium gondwanense]UXF00216.1 ABC transporter [Fervidobacterium riparium]SHN52182.1 ABC-2 type transport system permease protein [Fervidobacterium gondwanense DSM 13020]
MQFIKYELKRIFVKPSTYIVLFVIPVLFVLIGGIFFNSLASSNLKVGVYSEDKSPLSKFTVGVVMSLFRGGTIQYVGKDYLELLKKGELHAVVVIPNGFTNGLFTGRQTEIKYIPSPVDTQLSAAAYLVFQKMFEDLSGGPFFNPKVLQQMYTSSSVPAPKLVTENDLDFDRVFAPSLILLITMFVALMIGASTFVGDKETKFIRVISVGKARFSQYFLSKFLVTVAISCISGLVAYLVFLPSDMSVSVNDVLVLILFTSLFHSALGIFVSSLSRNYLISNLLGTALSILLIFSSGILTSISSLPRFVRNMLNFVPIYNSVYLLRLEQLFGAGSVNMQMFLKNSAVITTLTCGFLIVSFLVVKRETTPR